MISFYLKIYPNKIKFYSLKKKILTLVKVSFAPYRASILEHRILFCNEITLEAKCCKGNLYVYVRAILTKIEKTDVAYGFVRTSDL